MITALLIVGLITLGVFLIGRRLKLRGSELAAKLQELKNKNYVRIYINEDWIPGVYRLFSDSVTTQLVIAESTQTIFYFYNSEGQQIGVNYENHTPFFHRELPGKPPTGASVSI